MLNVRSEFELAKDSRIERKWIFWLGRIDEHFEHSWCPSLRFILRVCNSYINVLFDNFLDIQFDLIRSFQGGAFQGVQDTISPFGYKRGEGVDAGKGEPDWIVGKERHKYDSKFETLSPIDGKITGTSKCCLMIRRTCLDLVNEIVRIFGRLSSNLFTLAIKRVLSYKWVVRNGVPSLNVANRTPGYV